jgi:hypothetical protein
MDEAKIAGKDYDTENNNMVNMVKMENISAPVIQEDISTIQEDVSTIQENISARRENKTRVKTMDINEAHYNIGHMGEGTF